MRRAAVFLSLIALLGCTRSAPKTPSIVTRYLQALVANNARAAYDVTQLSVLARSPGSAVTFEHFRAALIARPVTSYRITNIHEAKVSGTTRSLFEVRVTLVTADGEREEVLTVEPEIVQAVTVEPIPIEIRGPDGIKGWSVDGIAVEPQRQSKLYRVIVVQGTHTIRAGARTLVVDAAPLAVRSGPARVEGTEPNRYLVLS
jgi:hypothetical protein